MHFHIDTGDFMPSFLRGFCVVNRFSKVKIVTSQTRSQCCRLARCVSSCIGFLTILSGTLSDKPTLLAVLYFPHPITSSFKPFAAPLIGALFLTALLSSVLMVSASAKLSILRRDVDRQKHFR